jgi:hypothetical protein
MNFSLSLKKSLKLHCLLFPHQTISALNSKAVTSFLFEFPQLSLFFIIDLVKLDSEQVKEERMQPHLW